MTASTAPNETRLPRQVVRQSEAIRARYTPPAEPETAPAGAPAAPAATPAAPPATTSVTPATPAPDPRESDPNYWKQRFSVTQGILAKERTDRQAERNELIRKNTELQTASPKSTAPDAAIDLSKFYTPEQITQYGEEQCRVMAKTAMDAARATAQDLIDAAVRPLKEQRERDVTDAAASAKQKFVDKLAELHPSYPEDDVDPRWLTWLADEENGVQRQQLLDIHMQNGSAANVAKMFKAWKATTVTATPLVAPSGSGAAPTGDAPPPADTGLTAPSDAEVKDYYKRSAIGKVKEPERVAFEARLKLRNPGS
jgi:hypothetical protein